jgi:peroxiredoxin
MRGAPRDISRARPQIGGDNPFTWKDVTTADIFKGKRVVIFSLPGAFTPTCSSTHLPGYEAKYEEIKACGVHRARARMCVRACAGGGRAGEKGGHCCAGT